MKRRATESSALWTFLEPRTTEPSALWTFLEPRTTEPSALWTFLGPRTTEPSALCACSLALKCEGVMLTRRLLVFATLSVQIAGAAKQPLTLQADYLAKMSGASARTNVDGMEAAVRRAGPRSCAVENIGL